MDRQLVLGLACTSLLVLAGCTSTTDTTRTASDPAAGTRDCAGDKHCLKFNAEASGWWTTDCVGLYSCIQDEKSTYAVVQISMTNHGTSNQDTNPLFFKLYTKSVVADVDFLATFSFSDSLENVHLRPGGSIEGVIAFKMQKNDTPEKVCYQAFLVGPFCAGLRSEASPVPHGTPNESNQGGPSEGGAPGNNTGNGESSAPPTSCPTGQKLEDGHCVSDEDPREPPAQLAPITFSGSGNRVTQDFATVSKPLKFHMSHTGAYNFAIWILNASTGEMQELAVNHIGPYDGSRYFDVDPGKHALDITADGPWTVNITQPRPPSGIPTPTNLSGTGDTAGDPLELEAGLRRFFLTHEGSGNFAVWLLDRTGNRVDLLANKMGGYSGEKAIGVQRTDLFYLDIMADGPWSIRVT